VLFVEQFKNRNMSKKKILELILNTAGFTMEKYQLIKDGSMTGYEFEAHLNGQFQFQVATDSFEDAVRETMEGIYDTEDVKFSAVS